MGGDGLTMASTLAVLNARYLQARLRGLFGMAVDSPCMHEFVATTRGGRVDGLLIMSPHLDARSLAESLPRELPVVLMNTRSDGVEVASLTVDNYGGACAMVRHLVGRGHKAIAFITGPEANFEAQERLRGYREALGELLPAAETLVLPGDFTEESGWRVGNRIVAMERRPQAIFAANDAMAIGCLFCLGEAGIQGPADACEAEERIDDSAWRLRAMRDHVVECELVHE